MRLKGRKRVCVCIVRGCPHTWERMRNSTQAHTHTLIFSHKKGCMKARARRNAIAQTFTEHGETHCIIALNMSQSQLRDRAVLACRDCDRGGLAIGQIFQGGLDSAACKAPS